VQVCAPEQLDEHAFLGGHSLGFYPRRFPRCNTNAGIARTLRFRRTRAAG
jgi:hypothetical protein